MKKLVIIMFAFLLVIGSIETHAETSDKYSFINKLTMEELKTIEKLVKTRIEELNDQYQEENLDDTGMWKIMYYLDAFGDTTNEPYISNFIYISGSFSNSATQDSKLNVQILINNEDEICIALFEYAGNNPVKSYGRDEYLVRLKDGDGNVKDISAVNYSDRLVLPKEDSIVLHNMLMQNSKVSFVIVERDNSINSYSFTINNASYYSNAYKILQNIKSEQQ